MMPDPFISSDAMSVDMRLTLVDAVKGDRREQLEAIRDYIAGQLEGHLCNTCLNSRLRTGDQASLILRLQTVLSEIDGLPKGEEVNRLERIRGAYGIGGASNVRPPGTPAETGAPDPSQQQRRTGSRKPWRRAPVW
jgi:hypothetical protein